MTDFSNREKAIKEIQEKYSQCNGKTFDCRDQDLQSDNFEQKSKLDFKPSSEKKDTNIRFLLNIRAKINIRIRIGQGILKRLSNYSTKV